MDTNAQIIADLQNKVGFRQNLDFLSQCKGVPVIVKGRIQEVHPESILFQVDPPDSICMREDETALILRDAFISGIQGRILAFDLAAGTIELGEFIYVDRGFGDRSIVRVEPDIPIEARLIVGEAALPCRVVDISLNGFGLLAESPRAAALAKGQAITLQLSLLRQKIEIPGALMGVFPKAESVRLAMTFSQEAPGSAVVTRYITHRRADIRQEIQASYQEALGKST